MCRPEENLDEGSKQEHKQKRKPRSTSSQQSQQNNNIRTMKRRGKRVKQNQLVPKVSSNANNDDMSDEEYSFTTITKPKKVQSSIRSRHDGETKSGGVEALIPTIIAVIVLGCAIVAKMGFRGRATVAGIDLGTTNSVICVQQQSKGSEVGEINCIPDPYNNSPIIPSVISFLDPQYSSKTRSFKKKEELGYDLDPSPSFVLVGDVAKNRIDTHPHHTLYHAKRVLGRPSDDDAVIELTNEVEFDIVKSSVVDDAADDSNMDGVVFSVPFHTKGTPIKNKAQATPTDENHISLHPHQVGSYVINHLMEITSQFLGHEVRSAVIAVPAKFNSAQRQATVQAYKDVGVKVARILEEPVAAALAYGLQKKDEVDYIIVYDFGGGTLDISVLQVFEGGYVEVIGNDGDNRLGGADFDAAVAHWLMDSNDGYGSKVVERVSNALIELEEIFQSHDHSKNEDSRIEERLVSECSKLKEIPLCSLSSFHTMGEKMKIELSAYVDSKGTVSKKCHGISSDAEYRPKQLSDFCSILEPIEFEISSEQFDQACSSLYDRSLSPVSRILKDLDMTVDEIDEVVMVGGTTRMPQIRQMVREELRVESLNTSIDPDLTVAYGAASVID
jgi:molecular chaperone DnaK (HSP70)